MSTCTHVRIRLAPVVCTAASATALSRIRAYHAAVRFLPFTMEAAAAAAIQADWLALRQFQQQQQQRGTIISAAAAATEALLHTWLNLARMAAQSFGELTLTAGRWAYVRSLEGQRMDRGRTYASMQPWCLPLPVQHTVVL